MHKTYFKLAWRNLVRNKTFSFINIFGLSVGLAACLLICAFLYDELSYDSYPEQAGQIYRVQLHFLQNGGTTDFGSVDIAVGNGMKMAYPEILASARLNQKGKAFVTYQGRTFEELSMATADSNFLELFSLPLEEGDRHTALVEQNSMVVTGAFAKKYFGSETPIGKLLSMQGKSYKVTGVMKPVPSNSHFHFDALISLSGVDSRNAGTWDNVGFYTYILLKKGTDPAKLEARFPDLVREHVAPELAREMNISLAEAEKGARGFQFFLQPLRDIHLHSNTKAELEANGNVQYIYIFGALALLILLLGCINFTNLSTASSSQRGREIGIRKVLGSVRRQLVGQFLSESLLLTALSIVIALGIALLLLPLFNQLAGKHITAGFFLNIRTIAFLLGLTLLVGILAGIYPAFFLSSIRTISVLKGGSGTLKPGQQKRLRSGLVVAQFVFSTALIISTIVVYRQLHYMQHIRLGYDKDQVLVIKDTYMLGHSAEAFKQQLLQDQRIRGASIAGSRPGNGDMDGTVVAPKEKQNGTGSIHINIYHVDYDYIPLLNMHLTAGRNFSPSFPSDSSEAVILNEAAVRDLGWGHTNPVGKALERSATSQYKVVGVVEDFHYASAKQKIAPLMMLLGHNNGTILLKIRTAEVTPLLADIKRQWDSYKTVNPFSYAFLDESFTRMYTAEQRTGQIFTIFAVIAVVIASLGLFGLAAFTAEQRKKEIGIRKVLGASVQQVLLDLTKEFFYLVLLACAVAIPLTGWAMHAWLQDFAYRIPLPVWAFAFAGVLSIVLALATISVQALRAALANPVKSLKCE